MLYHIPTRPPWKPKQLPQLCEDTNVVSNEALFESPCTAGGARVEVGRADEVEQDTF